MQGRTARKLQHVADADLAYNLRDAGLKQAWITNGVHTVRIPADAFGLFARK